MTRSQNSTIFAGQRFARLIAIERVDRDRRGNARWRFKCDCGNEKVIRVSEALDMRKRVTSAIILCGYPL